MQEVILLYYKSIQYSCGTDENAIINPLHTALRKGD
jgi:hypothetical protein